MSSIDKSLLIHAGAEVAIGGALALWFTTRLSASEKRIVELEATVKRLEETCVRAERVCDELTYRLSYPPSRTGGDRTTEREERTPARSAGVSRYATSGEETRMTPSRVPGLPIDRPGTTGRPVPPPTERERRPEPGSEERPHRDDRRSDPPQQVSRGTSRPTPTHRPPPDDRTPEGRPPPSERPPEGRPPSGDHRPSHSDRASAEVHHGSGHDTPHRRSGPSSSSDRPTEGYESEAVSSDEFDDAQLTRLMEAEIERSEGSGRSRSRPSSAAQSEDERPLARRPPAEPSVKKKSPTMM